MVLRPLMIILAQGYDRLSTEGIKIYTKCGKPPIKEDYCDEADEEPRKHVMVQHVHSNIISSY